MNIQFRKAVFAFTLLAILFSQFASAQINTGQLTGRINTVYSAIPFLRINPDTRAGGMGDLGLASTPDASSLYWNGAKLAFAAEPGGLEINFTPWLRELVSDIYIGHITGFKRIDDMQSIGASFRYFHLGSIQFTDINGADAGQYNPKELAIDFGYARKLSKNLSTGLTIKYVNSNLARGQAQDGGQIKAANAVAADISFYYQKELNYKSDLRVGTAITNVGNKVSYSDNAKKDFIPVNLGLGVGYTYHLNDYNKVSIMGEINKLMVPTPTDSLGSSNDKPLLSGMFGSFSDAPNGAKEELQELMYSIGMEYWYNDQFAVRLGHFNENALKGNRKYVTMGVGLKYNILGFNFSYLIPTTAIRNHPLENTLRVSLLFNFSDKMKLKEEPAE